MSRSVGLLFAALAGLIVLGFWAGPEVFHTFQYSPPQLTSFQQQNDAVDFKGVGLVVLLLWFVNYTVTFFVGTALFRASWPSKVSGAPAGIAGFWLGYLGLAGWSRLTSLVAGGPLFYFLTLMGVAWFLFWRRRDLRNSLRGGWQPLWWLGSVLGFIFILIVQVYQGDFRWNGHGPEQYAVKVAGWFGQPFPILLQHFDEMIYHAFLTEPLGVSYNPILPWWITLAINKVSVFVFLLLLFKEFGLNGLERWTASTFLFAGTLSLIPTHYYQLYDANNPLLYTVHSGRLLSVAMAALFMLWMGQSFRPGFAVQMILGLGLVSAPVTAFLWLPVLWILLANNSKLIVRQESLGIALAALLFTPWLYSDPSQTLVRIFLLVALGLFFAQLALVKFRWPRSKNFWPLAAVTTVSALLVGNFLSAQPLGRFFAELLNLEQVSLMYGGMLRMPPLEYLFGDYRELGEVYSLYSASTLDFTAIYGFLLWLAAAALILSPRERNWRWLAVLATLLPLVFILVDFTGISKRAWMLTRFLEVPVNLILLLSLLLLLNSRAKNWFQPLLWAFTALPILGTDRLVQWMANARALMELLSLR